MGRADVPRSVRPSVASALAAAAGILLAVTLVGWSPPWPPGSGVAIPILAILIASATASVALAQGVGSPMALRRRALGGLMGGCGLLMLYVALFVAFVHHVPQTQDGARRTVRVVGGWELRPGVEITGTVREALEIHGAPERLWTSTSLTTVRCALLGSFVAVFGLLVYGVVAMRMRSLLDAQDPRIEFDGTIFVTYRRGDSRQMTDRIYERLRDRYGQDRVFRDVQSIPLATDFHTEIEKALAEAVLGLVVIGPEWVAAKSESGNRRLALEDDLVRFEVRALLAAQVPVLPVLVETAEMPDPNSLPEDIRALVRNNAARVRSDPDFDTDIARIFLGLDKHLTELGKGGRAGSEMLTTA